MFDAAAIMAALMIEIAGEAPTSANLPACVSVVSASSASKPRPRWSATPTCSFMRTEVASLALTRFGCWLETVSSRSDRTVSHQFSGRMADGEACSVSPYLAARSISAS